jgi:hypothetical protein
MLTAIKEAKPLPERDITALLHGILVTSFNSLTQAPQNMFLDVVSVLCGGDSRSALLVWNSWWEGARGSLDLLQRLALVRIDKKKHTLQVHDLIRSFGRGILRGTVEVEPAGKAMSFVGSRVWVEDGGCLVKMKQVRAVE